MLSITSFHGSRGFFTNFDCVSLSSPFLHPPPPTPPDLAVFKERLRVLTVGGMQLMSP